MKTKRNSKHQHHSLDRISERIGVTNKKQALEMIRNASMRGLRPEAFEKYPDFYLYLLDKEYASGKRIRIYKKWVFVLNNTHKTGTGCTTVYEVPDEYKKYL